MNELENLYREQIELSQKLLSAIENQTSVLSKCITDESHRATVSNMREHNEIKSKVNVGIVQLVALMLTALVNLIIGN